MRYKIPNKKLFIRNRQKLVSQIMADSVVIVHSNEEMPRNGDQTFPYRQNSDFFYLTGLDQPKCLLLLCPDHPNPKKREMVFTEKTGEQAAVWEGQKYTQEQVTKISGIEGVHDLEDFEKQLHQCLLLFDNFYLNKNEHFGLQENFGKETRFIDDLKTKYPLHQFRRLAPVFKNLRMIKEPEEIDMMQKACNITAKGFDRVLHHLQPGMMEYAIEAEITYEFIRQGAAGHAYPPVVASGANACVLHYIDNDDRCEEGDLLLMDFGAEYGNYASDVSRTIPINGVFTKRQKQCYEAVLEVQKKAIDLLVPRKTLKEVNSEVRSMMEEVMIDLGLFSREEADRQDKEKPLSMQFFMHGLGHHIGLDVHDTADREVKLQEGMVLTCEPGLYIKDEGIGIRIEDDIVVGEKPVNLTAAIPKEAEEIEKIMKSGNSYEG